MRHTLIDYDRLKAKHSVTYKIETIEYLKGFFETLTPDEFRAIIGNVVNVAKRGEGKEKLGAVQILINTLLRLFKDYPQSDTHQIAGQRKTYSRIAMDRFLEEQEKKLALADEEEFTKQTRLPEDGEASGLTRS